MKTYKIGSSTSRSVWLALTIPLLAIVIITLATVKNSPQIIPWAIVFGIAFGIVLTGFIVSSIFENRKTFALSGNLSTATIEKIKKNPFSETYSTVFYKYKNEYGEECIGKCKLFKDWVEMLYEGETIPVHVKEKYAAFDMEEITTNKYVVKPTIVIKEEKEVFVAPKAYCEYCNSKYDIKLEKCPYCGAVNKAK